MFVGEPKRLSDPIPDPFLSKIPNVGDGRFCDYEKQSVIEVGHTRLLWADLKRFRGPEFTLQLLG